MRAEARNERRKMTCACQKEVWLETLNVLLNALLLKLNKAEPVFGQLFHEPVDGRHIRIDVELGRKRIDQAHRDKGLVCGRGGSGKEQA